MNEPNHLPQPSAAPSLASLLSRYLASRQEDHEITTEVEPHDAATGFRTNVAMTWAEATALFRLLNLPTERLGAPPDWSAFMATDAPQVLPLAAGLAPQRFRSLQLRAKSPTGPLPGLLGLRGWIRQAIKSKSPTQLLLAAGLALELGDVAEAQTALTTAKPLCTGDWEAAWLNQQGLYLLRAGQRADAEATWHQLTHAGLKAFNLGVLAAVTDQPKLAVERLEQAADALPEQSGWSHLARLYSTMLN